MRIMARNELMDYFEVAVLMTHEKSTETTGENSRVIFPGRCKAHQ